MASAAALRTNSLFPSLPCASAVPTKAPLAPAQVLQQKASATYEKRVLNVLGMYEARLAIANLRPLQTIEISRMKAFLARMKAKAKAQLTPDDLKRIAEKVNKLAPKMEIYLGSSGAVFLPQVQKKDVPDQTEPAAVKQGMAKSKSAPVLAKTGPLAKPAALISLKPPPNNAEALWARLKKSAIASAFLEKVQKELASLGQKPLQLIFCPPAEVPFGADYAFLESTIRISCDCSEQKQLESLMFELANALQTGKFLLVYDKLKKGLFPKGVDYARACEEVELQSAKIYTETIEECIKKDGWDPFMNKYAFSLRKAWTTFEKFWEFQLDNGHALYYIQRHRLAMSILGKGIT